jgi:hypothetical protein
MPTAWHIRPQNARLLSMIHLRRVDAPAIAATLGKSKLLFEM